MKREERRLFFVVLAVLLFALVLVLARWGLGANTPKVYHVSVLLDGTESDYWKNFRGGVGQAALEHNVDVRFISHYDGSPVPAQVEALQREWAGEADGIVLLPIDGGAVADALRSAPSDLAVAIMGPNLPEALPVSYISADYAGMGARLADAADTQGARTCTVFLSPGHGTAATLIYDGLSARLATLGIACTKTIADPAQPFLIAAEGALVTVEPAMTAALCQDPLAAGRVCGVGTSNRLLHYLEDGTVAALVVQSDYDAGYLSLLRVVDMLSGRAPKDTVLKSYTATAANMFEDPMIQILFAAP